MNYWILAFVLLSVFYAINRRKTILGLMSKLRSINPTTTVTIWQKLRQIRPLVLAWITANIAAIMIMPGWYGKFILGWPIVWLGFQMLVITFGIIWAGSEGAGQKGRKWLNLFTIVVFIVGIIHQLKLSEFYDQEICEILKGVGVIISEASAKEIGTTQVVSAPSELKLDIPPAPNWSRSLTKQDIPQWVRFTIDSTQREFRYKTADGKVGVSNDTNPASFPGETWIGLKFQSTSKNQEAITFTW